MLNRMPFYLINVSYTNFIILLDIKCTRIYPTPYVRVGCPYGYRTGSYCNITCEPGKTLTGSDFVTCDRDPDGFYGLWNWQGGKQSTCQSKYGIYLPKFKKKSFLYDFFEMIQNSYRQ